MEWPIITLFESGSMEDEPAQAWQDMVRDRRASQDGGYKLC